MKNFFKEIRWFTIFASVLYIGAFVFLILGHTEIAVALGVLSVPPVLVGARAY